MVALDEVVCRVDDHALDLALVAGRVGCGAFQRAPTGHAAAEPGCGNRVAVEPQHTLAEQNYAHAPPHQGRHVQGGFGHAEHRDRQHFARGRHGGVVGDDDQNAVAVARMFGDERHRRMLGNRVFAARADHACAETAGDGADLGAGRSRQARGLGHFARDEFGGVGIDQQQTHRGALV